MMVDYSHDNSSSFSLTCICTFQQIYFQTKRNFQKRFMPHIVASASPSLCPDSMCDRMSHVKMCSYGSAPYEYISHRNTPNDQLKVVIIFIKSRKKMCNLYACK